VPAVGADAVAAQALADVATISILQERVVSDLSVTKQQLQRALDSRVLIEQAKGFVAHTHDLDMKAAYRLIRHQARTTQTKIAEVARAIVEDGQVLELTDPPQADNAPARARTEGLGA
jgi:AmiR/NasT family two-component response regulator